MNLRTGEYEVGTLAEIFIDMHVEGGGGVRLPDEQLRRGHLDESPSTECRLRTAARDPIPIARSQQAGLTVIEVWRWGPRGTPPPHVSSR